MGFIGLELTSHDDSNIKYCINLKNVVSITRGNITIIECVDGMCYYVNEEYDYVIEKINKANFYY